MLFQDLFPARMGKIRTIHFVTKELRNIRELNTCCDAEPLDDFCNKFNEAGA